MKDLQISWVSLAAAAVLSTAACGGKSATPEQPGPGAAAGTPFDPEAVRAALAATPQSSAPACGDPDDINTTLGDLFGVQSANLGPGDVNFTCRPDSGDGLWNCEWSVFTKPAGAPDPDDPCAEGGSSGFQIMVKVGADGVLAHETIVCVAPG